MEAKNRNGGGRGSFRLEMRGLDCILGGCTISMNITNGYMLLSR